MKSFVRHAKIVVLDLGRARASPLRRRRQGLGVGASLTRVMVSIGLGRLRLLVENLLHVRSGAPCAPSSKPKSDMDILAGKRTGAMENLQGHAGFLR